MATRKRVKAEPTPEFVPGQTDYPASHFEIEEVELDEFGTEIEAPEPEAPVVSSGIVVTTQEPTVYFRDGSSVLKAGGIRHRIFDEATHGKDWRNIAMEFIATHQLEDGERRPKYVKHEEY